MSTCIKHGQTIGSQRANSPLWPGINACQLIEAEYTCAVDPKKPKDSLLANEEESIYGHSRSYGVCLKSNTGHSRIVAPDYGLLKAANLGKANHNVKVLDAFRPACADDFIFIDLAFCCDLHFARGLPSEYGA